MKRTILFLFLMCGFLSPSFATDGKDLKKVEQEISEHKQKALEIEKKAQANEAELKKIQAKSIKIAESLKNDQSEVASLKEELTDLSASIRIKQMELEKNKENSKSILSSLIRISSIPTDGFMVASDDPQQLINTRILLNSAMPHLTEQAKKLQDDIDFIVKSQEDIEKKQDNIANLSKKTKAEMKEIENLISQKKKLKSQLSSEQKKEESELKELAKEASSIKEFIKKLQSRKITAKPGVKPSAPTRVVKTYTVPEKPKYVFTSKGNLPTEGKIVLGYDQKNAMDVTNKGWEIEGNQNGLVTCPLAGDVLYSGEFGSYDHMIVLDNGSGYNMVLAGIGQTDIQAGDAIEAGEPVGFLKSKRLYLEVRYNGNPVNPNKVIR